MASSSSSIQQKYQVFLSFRGEDTRYNFTSHLYAALQRKAIETFIDDELPRGEEISPTLLKAIEESKISIVILSKNYPSSKWCLDELCKILECKNTHGQMVIPIFYHVDPSDVRKQTGSFAEAFAKHEQHLKVQRWRAAFKEIGNLSGWHLQDRSESKLIEEIVKNISKKLIYKSSYDSKGLIGLKSHIQQIESLLCINSVEVRVVGIWGMGGIGKTTLAEAVFYQNIDKFEGCCFLANVREELHKYGQVYLREKLLSTILEEGNLGISTSLLPNWIIDRLHCKKVLVVLDDVNDSSQLDILPEKHCFGPGSKIIVTSRDKQVLQKVVDGIYEVKGLIEEEAFQLFSLNAFKQRHPMEGWMELSKKVIDYAKGFPLALKVLGSALYGKSKREWESELNKLEKIPNPKIHNLLRISYDGLDDEVKNIFLDIACFFEENYRDYIAKILDGCYFSVYSGISVLVDKSLVTISHMYDNLLGMHDLIREMGWNIVRQESIKDIGRRSRLWNAEDVYHVLKNNSGTKAVESISLDMSKIREVHLKRATFKRMYNLRLLEFYYSDSRRDRKVHLSQNALECLSDKLCYLYWDGYPLNCLPSNVCMENLVELNMPYSHVERLWNGVQNLVKLKRLNLCLSQHLIEIPDLSHATNLESIELIGCTSLVGVPSSIGHLNKLRDLDLENCKNLRNLPNIVHLRSLQNLGLSGCSNLTKLPELPRELENLWLNGCAIEEVPLSSNLGLLDISDCLKLKSFPEILEPMEELQELVLSGVGIEELPSSIEHLIGLDFLNLTNCKNLKKLPNSIWKLKSLNCLDLSGCSNLLKFPEALEYSEEVTFSFPSEFKRGLDELQFLYLQNCTELKSLPNSISDMRSLKELNLAGCSKLVEWQDKLKNSKSVVHLCLSDCNLLEFPSNLTCMSWLERLDLRGNNFETIPPSIKQLSVLRQLDLSYCKRLQSIPELPLSLFTLVANHCTKLEVESLTEVLKDWGLFRGDSKSFGFINCLKLDQHAMGSIVAEAKLRLQQGVCSLATDMESKIPEKSSMTIAFPGSEIPNWFDYQSTGSTISILLPQHSSDFKFVGFIVCLVVVAFEDYNNDKSIMIRCQSTRLSVPIFTLPKYGWRWTDLPRLADQVVLGYTFQLCADLSGEHHSNKVSFDFDFTEEWEKKPVDGFKVKKCGVHLLSPDENLVSIHAQDTECNPNHYPIVEDGKRCRDDYCYNEATPSENSSSNEEEEEPSPKRLKYYKFF